MTYDITHGVGGLWEVHRWTSAAGLVFDLNVQDVDNRVELEEIPGLHTLAPSEDPRAKHAGRHGDVSRDRTFSGKPVAYKGELCARTLTGMYLTRTAALAAFADRRPGVMEIIRHADHPGPTARYTARAFELDIPEVQSSNLYHRDFTLGLFLDDPRFYFPSLSVDETHASAVTVTNEGSAPADPVIIVNVPAGGPDVVLSDGTRTLTILAAPEGEVTVDFAARTVLYDSYPLALNLSASGWWDPYVEGIAPGATVTITQAGASDLTVQFTPSVW